MNCGNASCHEANSIHRIIHVTDSGAGTHLRITAAGNEDDYQRPTFTPEIESVHGEIGSSELVVTFRPSDYGAGTPGLYANADLTGALEAEDFWLIDKNGNNAGRTIAVSHIAGETTATIAMSQPLTQEDLLTDTLAMQPASLWGWYQGGYENWATGIIGEQAVSAGPWPVAVTTGPDPGFVMTKVEGVGNYDRIHVEFSEAAYASTDGTGDRLGVRHLRSRDELNDPSLRRTPSFSQRVS